MGTRSFALEGIQLSHGTPLVPVSNPPTQAHSKIGLLTLTNPATRTAHTEASDVASIVRPLNDDVGTQLHYVVFALGFAAASHPTSLAAAHRAAETSAITDVRRLASNLDQALADRHTESNP